MLVDHTFDNSSTLAIYGAAILWKLRSLPTVVVSCEVT